MATLFVSQEQISIHDGEVYAVLHEAIAAAEYGDTVVVLPGVYELKAAQGFLEERAVADFIERAWDFHDNYLTPDEFVVPLKSPASSGGTPSGWTPGMCALFVAMGMIVERKDNVVGRREFLRGRW